MVDCTAIDEGVGRHLLWMFIVLSNFLDLYRCLYTYLYVYLDIKIVNVTGIYGGVGLYSFINVYISMCVYVFINNYV